MKSYRMPVEEFAKVISKETNPYQAGNYAGDVSKTEWEKFQVFTLYTYAFRIADFIEESNYETILSMLTEVEPSGNFWASEYISSWLTPFERITIYPFGRDLENPAEFNYDVVATCQDILNSLADYPILDEDDLLERESDWFNEELFFELRSYEPDDPIFEIVQKAFDESSGEYEDFLYNILPDIIRDYEESLED